MLVNVDGQGAALGGPVPAWFGDALKLAGLAAAVLYGVFSRAYRAFYDELGVRPEEVGVDRAQIITQAAVALVFLLSLALFFGVLLNVFFIQLLEFREGCRDLWHWIRRRLWPWILRRPSPPALGSTLGFLPKRPAPLSVTAVWLVGLSAVPGFTAALMLAVEAPGAVDTMGVQLAVLGVLLAALGGVTLQFRHKRWAQPHPRLSYKRSAVFGAVLGVFVLLVASPEVGSAQARYLEDKGHVSGTANASYSLISFTAMCVQVAAVGQASVPPAGDRLLLLGSASGTDVMWDTTTRQVIRLPTSTVTLRSCPR